MTRLALSAAVVALTAGAGAPLEAPDSSRLDAGFLAGIAAGTTASIVAMGSAVWYARRRWQR